MTFTTPSCPLADTIKEMVNNAVLVAVPGFTVDIEITFDPMWSMDSIKDSDLKRLFE
jgi:metal-sulfur cluster biosynthetic enzyme